MRGIPAGLKPYGERLDLCDIIADTSLSGVVPLWVPTGVDVR